MNQPERNKQLIRRFIDEVFNTGNVDLLADLVSPDCVETDGKVRIVSGVTGMAEHINAVRAIYTAGKISYVSNTESHAVVRAGNNHHIYRWDTLPIASPNARLFPHRGQRAGLC